MALRALAAGALALVLLVACGADDPSDGASTTPTAAVPSASGTPSVNVRPSPLPTDLPRVPAATRRELRRAAQAVLVPVEGYRFEEPGAPAATTITSLALPVMIEAFGEQVPPGVLMREFFQDNRQYGFVLVGVVPRADADRDASGRAAFRLAGVLAQAQTPPTVVRVGGIQVNRLKNPENEADVATWSPDGMTVIAVVSFGPAHADALTNGLILGDE